MRVIAADAMVGVPLATVLDVVRRGGVICFPTDTAYGLGVDPSNESAVARLFEIKGRTADKPILLLVDSMEMAKAEIEDTARFEEVASSFWPGPITLVVKAAPTVGKAAIGRGTSVGLRWPSAVLTTKLVGGLGHPLTGTSANRSGLGAARSASEAIDQLGDAIDLVIDGGPSPAISPSTVLDLTSDPPLVLREGPISYDVLSEFFGGHIRKANL